MDGRDGPESTENSGVVPFVDRLNNQLTLFNAYLSQQSTVNVGSFRLQA